jgi:hypothetical protein
VILAALLLAAVGVTLLGVAGDQFRPAALILLYAGCAWTGVLVTISTLSGSALSSSFSPLAVALGLVVGLLAGLLFHLGGDRLS